MDTDERDEEIFEINDFTNATPWETFIADIERVLHQWGLAAADEQVEEDSGRQHNKSERLMYAGRRFVMTLVVSGDSETTPSPGAADTRRLDENMRAWSPVMVDMMDGRRDFPSDGHNITKWYGVAQFVLLAPDEGVECLSSQAQAKLVLSSASIAIANTRCVVPFFIQTHKKWRHLYVGVAEGNGIRVNFDTVHLKQAPSKFTHLSGLLELFKSKISPMTRKVSPVHLSVRYTYIIRQWNLDDWPVELPEEVEEGKKVAYYKTLPVGAFSDPISELHLSTVWPNLSEELVVDRDSQHSDLQPSHAPIWTVITHLADRAECYLADCLQSFLKVCYRDDSLGQLVGSEREGYGSSPHFSHALDRLTNMSVSSMQSPFLSSVVYSAAQRLEFGIRGEGNLSDKKLEGILKCLFPDAYDLPAEEVEVDRDTATIKSSPRGSLSRVLATVLSIVNNDNGLRGFAEVWNETVQELRYRWDQAIPINSLPEGSPDTRYCLFHQKLQMLNCCIDHKKKHDHSAQEPAGAKVKSSKTESSSELAGASSVAKDNPTSSDKEITGARETGDSDDTDEEFFEALESQVASPPSPLPVDKSGEKIKIDSAVPGSPLPSGEEDASDAGWCGRSGVLKRCGDLVLVGTGEPLCVPVTQEHTPMTEDMMWEQQNILSRLGTSQQAAKVRAKMQTTSLLSDMQAFKAANPGSLLEDFVRWYSPRDWVEEVTPPASPSTSARGDGEESSTPEGTKGSVRHELCGDRTDEDKSMESEIDAEGVETEESQNSAGMDREDSKKEQDERSEGDCIGSVKSEGVVGSSPVGEDVGETEDDGQANGGVGVEDKEVEGDWAQDGWGQEDWNVSTEEHRDGDVTSGSGQEREPASLSHRYCKGHLSERMLQPDNLWVETWKQATPIPTHKQTRLFNDTKEAEKVLHYFANMKPSELAVSLMPLLLHSSVEALKKRQEESNGSDKAMAKKPLARVDGLLADVLAMLATVQNPSLESLPLYQECIGLLSQAEHLLASAQSLKSKLYHGILLARRQEDKGGAAVTDESREVCICTEMMLEGPELVIRDPMNSVVGVAMKGLLESQGTYQALSDARSQGHHATPQANPFPSATRREFILRCSSPCPTLRCRLCPHRMYCSLQKGVEFRVAGAFALDTNFH